jgi:methionine aminopeptidase
MRLNLQQINSFTRLKHLKFPGRLLIMISRRFYLFPSPISIDRFVEKLCNRHGYLSAPRELGFPGFTCISLNNRICHGIPDNRLFKAGDFLTIDISLKCKETGLYVDVARPFYVSYRENNRSPVPRWFKLALSINSSCIRRFINMHTYLWEDIGSCFHELIIKYKNYAPLHTSKRYVGHGVGVKCLHRSDIEILHHKTSSSNVASNAIICIEPIYTIKEHPLLFDKWGFMNKYICVSYENMYLWYQEKLHLLTIFRTSPFVYLRNE